VTTTKATLLDRHQGIPLNRLPLIIQDAIQVTRDLEFWYLWIDALCIIQDDSEDKNIEISRMGSIYKNATLTIAAANTIGVQDSFLAPRPAPRSCTFPYLLPDGRFGTLWVKPRYTDHLLNPLDSRAWALQESLLSPRVLWYGPANLKWKCNVAQFAVVWKTSVHYFLCLAANKKSLPRSIFGLPEKLVTDEEPEEVLRSEL
jgi:hypothetical protein